MVQNLQEKTSLLRLQTPLSSNTTHWLRPGEKETSVGMVPLKSACVRYLFICFFNSIIIITTNRGIYNTHKHRYINTLQPLCRHVVEGILNTEMITTIIFFNFKTATCIIIYSQTDCADPQPGFLLFDCCVILAHLTRTQTDMLAGRIQGQYRPAMFSPRIVYQRMQFLPLCILRFNYPEYHPLAGGFYMKRS